MGVHNAYTILNGTRTWSTYKYVHKLFHNMTMIKHLRFPTKMQKYANKQYNEYT